MNPVDTLRKHIVSGASRYSLLAVGTIITLMLCDVVFVGSVILPEWQTRVGLASQLTIAERQISKAGRTGGDSPDEMRRRLEAMQGELAQAASLFVSESQAAAALDQLYLYADEIGVEILSLQQQPGEGEEKRESYDVRTFQLRGAGTVRNLLAFVSEIGETETAAFMITDVDVVEGDNTHVLSVVITLYTSRYASVTSGDMPSVASVEVTE